MDGFKQLYYNFKKVGQIKEKPPTEWTRSEFIFVQEATNDIMVGEIALF
jgi:hypothetical protein